MFQNKWIVFIFIISVNEMVCLRVSELRMVPSAVQRDGRVVMHCLYELDGELLYCVKWYRGFYEFYRYCPSEKPAAKVFPRISVDVSASNATQVVIPKVQSFLAGQFTCEVSADEPTFHTARTSNYMEVVSIPQGGPVIVSEHSVYDPGDILRVNCSVPPSLPKSNITMLINDKQIKPGHVNYREVEKGLFKGQLHVSLPLLSEHFAKGPPVLKCIANISDLYSQYAELPLKSSRGPPIFGRVTLNKSSSLRLCKYLAMILSCTILTRHPKWS
ncbi:uncharacterized protein LOC143919258 [Arctopsyche grandis]|uniref:uncharacterized protein LOC143919258 n=1 Tax=Arctopsyche grandis TaxID=121162 RepID=UPI00406D8E57